VKSSHHRWAGRTRTAARGLTNEGVSTMIKAG
jgi:hypothetical protein